MMGCLYIYISILAMCMCVHCNVYCVVSMCVLIEAVAQWVMTFEMV